MAFFGFTAIFRKGILLEDHSVAPLYLQSVPRNQGKFLKFPGAEWWVLLSVLRKRLWGECTVPVYQPEPQAFEIGCHISIKLGSLLWFPFILLSAPGHNFHLLSL